MRVVRACTAFDHRHPGWGAVIAASATAAAGSLLSAILRRAGAGARTADGCGRAAAAAGWALIVLDRITSHGIVKRQLGVAGADGVEPPTSRSWVIGL